MTKDFAEWLAQNGLAAIFTTSAGDSFFANRDKKFGVIKRAGEYNTFSFYLDDIVGFTTFDDENLVAEWKYRSPWRILPRNTNFSTEEVFINISFRNGSSIRLCIFKAVGSNVRRNTNEHIELLNYACRISHAVYDLANGN